MNLLEEYHIAWLIENAAEKADHYPIVKLFLPGTDFVWLLTHIESSNRHIAYGLFDLGDLNPKMGYFDLDKIQKLKGKFGLPLMRDKLFVPRYPISVYEVAAKDSCMITEKVRDLNFYASYLSRQR